MLANSHSFYSACSRLPVFSEAIKKCVLRVSHNDYTACKCEVFNFSLNKLHLFLLVLDDTKAPKGFT